MPSIPTGSLGQFPGRRRESVRPALYFLYRHKAFAVCQAAEAIFCYSIVMDLHQQSLKHLAKVDPVMAGLIKRANVKPLKAKRNHFESLAVSIINQQLSGKAADTIEKRLRAIYGGKFPLPSAVLKTRDGQLRNCGLSFGKISYIKNLARAVERGSVDFKKLIKASDEEVISELIKVKGIGRWTAEMFLMFSLARPNVFSHGDLGLRNGLKKMYKIDLSRLGGRAKADAKRHNRKLQKLLDLWHPHKTVASRHLWASLRLD